MALPRITAICFAGALSLSCTAASALAGLAEVNHSTITVLSGEAQWFPETVAIGQSVAYQKGMRVLPMQGDGCIDSAADVMQLTQVDMAILSADCVAYARAQGLLPNAEKKLAYVTRLKALPILIVTTRDISNVTALAGKRIATGPANSATFASGEFLLGGLDLPFVRVPQSGEAAFELLQQGQADAVLLQGTSALPPQLDAKRYHVLGLTAPRALVATYAPAMVDSSDLKGLAGKGKSIETVSTSLVLAVYNWPKQSAKAQKIRKFTQIYFEDRASGNNANELSVTVPGWQRHDISQRALEALTITPDDIQQGDGP